MYYKASHTRGGLLVSALLLCIWTLFPTQVLGDTLTYRFAPHERSCFFVLAKAKGEKLAVYYSVRLSLE